MRLIKLALISFAVFFAIITAMSLLIPGHIRISKVVTLSSKNSSVSSLVRDLDNWPLWHPAFKGQNMQTVLRQNHLSLKTVAKTDSLVQVAWQQEGKAPVLNSWEIHRFGAADSVALQWYMDFRLQWYPWLKFSSLFYEKTYGSLMEQGLQNIKTLVQQQP